MAEPARPIPVKLDAETLAALDALVLAGRQPTRSSAIRAGIELLLDAEHRRALDLGLGHAAANAGRSPGTARRRERREPVVARASIVQAAAASREDVAPERMSPMPPAAPPPAPPEQIARVRAEPPPEPAPEVPADVESEVIPEVVAESPPEVAPEPEVPPEPRGPSPGLSVDW
jgi:Arc/MetJ-type ribon-helix-helix transcriptional regulator